MKVVCAVLFASALSAVAEDAAPHSHLGKVFSVEGVTAAILPDDGSGHPKISVTATGMVNSGGWSDPELSAYVYVTAPEDGIQAFDFIATMPPEDSMVTMSLEEFTATISGGLAPWVKGVRVQSSTNSEVFMLDGLPEFAALPPIEEPDLAAPNVDAEGKPLPWPFPWYTPQLKAQVR